MGATGEYMQNDFIVIDAFAAPGGDGSDGAPLKTIPPHFTARQVRLRAGLYQGPFVLPANVELIGSGAAVLFVEGGETPVVTAAGALRLRGVSLQGGSIGLVTDDTATLDLVHFSGHRVAAVQSGPKADVTLRECELKGLTSESKGLIANGGSVLLDQVTFTGAYGRGIEASQSRITAQRTTWEGPRTALHLTGGTATIRESSSRGGSGPAFFASKGALELDRVTVHGHEYAVQTAANTTLTVKDFTASKPLHAAFGLVQTHATLTGLTLGASGDMGAIQSIDSQLELTHSTITDSRSTGLMARKGSLLLVDVRFSGVAAEVDGSGAKSLGDALHVRDAKATLKNVVVSGAEGSSVYITAKAEVRIEQLVSTGAGEGALLVERGAHVEVHGLTASGSTSPAVAVIDGASLDIDGLRVSDSDTPLWAQCGDGVSVTVTGPSVPPVKPAPCIHLK